MVKFITLNREIIPLMNKLKFKNSIKANGLQYKKSLVVLNSMVEKNIKNQYRKSVLGILWTVLNPLLNMLVMSFVFSKIFGRGSIGIDYPVYVLSGNIVFALLRASTTSSLTCIVGNYDLLTKTRIPKAIFPLSNLFSATVNFGFSLIALILVMVVRIFMDANVQFHWTFLMILVWLPSLMMFCLGLSFILSAIYVRFRDIKHLYGVFLTLWMYLTPVFYTIDLLDNPLAKKVLNFNPMLYYLTYFREIIAIGTIPSLTTHLICYGVGIWSLIIGYTVFTLSKKKFVLYI